MCIYTTYLISGGWIRHTGKGWTGMGNWLSSDVQSTTIAGGVWAGTWDFIALLHGMCLSILFSHLPNRRVWPEPRHCKDTYQSRAVMLKI